MSPAACKKSVSSFLSDGEAPGLWSAEFLAIGYVRPGSSGRAEWRPADPHPEPKSRPLPRVEVMESADTPGSIDSTTSPSSMSGAMETRSRETEQQPTTTYRTRTEIKQVALEDAANTENDVRDTQVIHGKQNK